MHILCFGDSNTYGYDPRTDSGGRYPALDRWVDILAQKSGWKIRNRGENGREIPHTPGTISQAQRMMQANKSADLFLVMLGTNDLLHGEAVSESAARMERFLQEMLPFCKKILLIAPPPMQCGEWVTEKSLLTRSAQLGKAYRAVACRLGIDFADAARWNVELGEDGVHFSQAGSRSFAQGLYDHLLAHF